MTKYTNSATWKRYGKKMKAMYDSADSRKIMWDSGYMIRLVLEETKTPTKNTSHGAVATW